MAYPTDNPLDGRGARPDGYDGGIYACGTTVRVRPKRGPSGGITMGGVVARCDNEEQAAEIARRCAAHGSMLKALRMAREAIEALHGPVAWEIYERESPEMRAIDAALAMGAEQAPATPRVPTITTGGGEI